MVFKPLEQILPNFCFLGKPLGADPPSIDCPSLRDCVEASVGDSNTMSHRKATIGRIFWWRTFLSS
jgi:hypothetical protein